MSTTQRCLVVAAAIVLVACTERPQNLAPDKAGKEPWAGPATAFTAPGWKPGDPTSWNDEIRQRTQGQNEYVRIGQ